MAIGEIFVSANEKIAETARNSAGLRDDVVKIDTKDRFDFSNSSKKNNSATKEIDKKIDLSKRKVSEKAVIEVDTRKAFDFSKFNELKKSDVIRIKNNYIEDMKKRSEFAFDIDSKNIQSRKFDRVSPEKVAEKRQEFKMLRGALRQEWAKKNGIEWPTYKNDVYDNGTCIRKAGQMYDAHHKQPLEFGGKNEVSNITPFHVKDHYDSKGIHSKDSPFKQLEKMLGEK